LIGFHSFVFSCFVFQIYATKIVIYLDCISIFSLLFVVGCDKNAEDAYGTGLAQKMLFLLYHIKKNEENQKR